VTDHQEFAEAARQMSSVLRPLLVAEEGTGRKRLYGTVTVVGFGDYRVLLTAEHCLSGPAPKFVMPTPGSVERWPASYERLVPARQHIPEADLAFTGVQLDPYADAEAQQGLSPAQIATSSDCEEGQSLLAVGFLANSKVRGHEARLHAKMMYAVAHAAPPAAYTALGAHPDTCITAHFDRSTSLTLDGETVTAADPHGMSGGALFSIGRRDDPEHGQIVHLLVGILKRFPLDMGGSFVATRFDRIAEAIQLSAPSPSQAYVVART
jgi:hypothetical protein